MFAVPRADIKPNTLAYETVPLIKPTGFREYDARWLFPGDVSLLGFQAIGLGLATVLHDLGVEPRIIVGHDYRSYSMAVKQAVVTGLMAGGMEVHDIGLALSPTAYFAQFAYDCPAVAMVTASHNENGWTGIKMGAARPLTFGPDEMNRLRETVLAGKGVARKGGGLIVHHDAAERYCADLAAGKKLKRKIRAVVATGNGTAGAFAPRVLSAIGVDVVPLHTELDHSFPHHNPNPEDMEMLHAVADAVKSGKADLGLCFDGDGDRCGVVDDLGHEIFADKMGLLIARDLAPLHPNAKFVVDVKSTGLFATDPVLAAHGATTDYWKTGHSYIKRRCHELKALAGFEKSGHYFFNPPIGRGYDDGIVSAIAVLEMLDRAGRKLSELVRELPVSFGSPTMSPFCPDERKYQVVADVTSRFTAMHAKGDNFAGQKITSLVTVNGVRVSVADGTWGLVRASSNKPGLVVVCESTVSDARMRAMFAAIENLLATYPEIGAWDQKLPPPL